MGECIVALLGIVMKCCGAQDMVGLFCEPFELRRRYDKDGFAGKVG